MKTRNGNHKADVAVVYICILSPTDDLSMATSSVSDEGEDAVMREEDAMSVMEPTDNEE